MPTERRRASCWDAGETVFDPATVKTVEDLERDYWEARNRRERYRRKFDLSVGLIALAFLAAVVIGVFS